MRPPVRIVANAGPQVGLGHLVRSAVLANALSSQGVRVELLAPAIARFPDAARVLGQEPTWMNAPASDTTIAAVADGASGVIVDSYEAFRGPGPGVDLPLAVIDDLADRQLPVDVVVNPSIRATELVSVYEHLSPGGVFLGGPGFSLLREPFQTLPVKSAPSARPLRVLVSLGGADEQQLLPRLVNALASSPEVESQDVISPVYAVSSANPGVRVHRAIDSVELCDLMSRADLAVSAGGQTLHELARAGVPTVGIETGPDQRPNLAGFARAGVVHLMGRGDAVDIIEATVAAVERLAKDPDGRERSSRAGQGLSDGRGAERVAHAIRERWHL